MLFKKLSAPSLKELFVAELEGMILSGKLEIGAKLPPERELAESMQVSRAVVNSGLDEMEKKGFLVVKPRIGTFVADYRKYGTADTLAVSYTPWSPSCSTTAVCSATRKCAPFWKSASCS